MVSHGVPSRPWCWICSRRHSCRSRAATPDWIERLDEIQGALDLAGRPWPHRGDLVDRHIQVPVLVQVPDDGRTDLPQPILVRLLTELSQQMVRQRRAGRQRVLDRRALLELGRGPGPITVFQVVAEEVLVVRVVPAVPAVGRLRVGRGRLIRRGLPVLLGGLGGRALVRNLLEHRILDEFLGQVVGELEPSTWAAA